MFDRLRQPRQCSIVTDCGGELAWFCQLAVPQCGGYYGEMQTQNQSPRHSPGRGEGGVGAVVTNDLCIKMN